jgi:hypothetical protein
VFQRFPGHNQANEFEAPVTDPAEVFVHVFERKRTANVRYIPMVEEGIDISGMRRETDRDLAIPREADTTKLQYAVRLVAHKVLAFNANATTHP